MAKTVQLPAIVVALALVAGCNTTPVTRSPGAAGAPGAPGTAPPSAGSSGPSGPSVRVEAPGLPGLPAPGAGTDPGESPGAPVPGRVSLPTPPAGTRSAGGDGASSPGRSGARQQPAGSTSAGAGGPGQTEDEILAAALQALEGRPAAGQPGDTAAGHGAGAGTSDPAMTGVEKQQALGQELQQGFAEFDRVMLDEQQANDARADEQGGGFAGNDAFATAEDAAEDAAADPMQTAMIDSDGRPVEGPAAGRAEESVKAAGDVAAPSVSQIPEDLADASDDDIIARQLREAAMKERDPELKKKLWDEYRKYKRDGR